MLAEFLEQRRLRTTSARQHGDAGGPAIEPVHEQRLRFPLAERTQQSAAEIRQRRPASEIVLRGDPGRLVDREQEGVEVEQAFAAERLRLLVPQRHLDLVAGPHLGLGITHAPPAQERGPARDRCPRFLLGDPAALGDEAREDAVGARDKLQLRGLPLQPFSTTRTGNFETAEQTMPCGPAIRS